MLTPRYIDTMELLKMHRGSQVHIFFQKDSNLDVTVVSLVEK